MDTCVDSDVFVRVWLLVFREEANGRKELTGGILSVNTILNRVTINLYIFLLIFKLITC